MKWHISSDQLVSWRESIPFGLRDAVLALMLPIFLPLLAYTVLIFWSNVGILPIWVQAIRGESPTALALQYLLTLVIEIGILAVLVKKTGAGLKGLGLRKPQKIWFLLVLGLYIVQISLIITIFMLVKMIIPAIDTEQEQAVLEFGRSGWGYLLSAVSSVMVAPVIEELLFRGILFAGLAKRWPIWLAAVVSSLAFAFLHGQVNVGIYTFILGCLLSWSYVRSGSLYPGIVLHFVNNLVAFVLLAQP